MKPRKIENQSKSRWRKMQYLIKLIQEIKTQMDNNCKKYYQRWENIRFKSNLDICSILGKCRGFRSVCPLGVVALLPTDSIL